MIVVGDTFSYLPRKKKKFEINGPLSQAKWSITELSEKIIGITSFSLSSKLI